MTSLTVLLPEGAKVLEVPSGSNLRRVLLAAGLSPYTAVTRRANCGGRGLCATCGVWIEGQPPPPIHWHDQLADGFGYPRLSCQITITAAMTVRLVDDKWVWGRRDSERATWFQAPSDS